jgi:hypothetical protein
MYECNKLANWIAGSNCGGTFSMNYSIAKYNLYCGLGLSVNYCYLVSSLSNIQTNRYHRGRIYCDVWVLWHEIVSKLPIIWSKTNWHSTNKSD